MDKLRAIWKIIRCKHFYLITADKNLLCTEERSMRTKQATIASMIQLEWVPFWKNVFIDNHKDGEKYV